MKPEALTAVVRKAYPNRRVRIVLGDCVPYRPRIIGQPDMACVALDSDSKLHPSLRFAAMVDLTRNDPLEQIERQRAQHYVSWRAR
jgi:hypothetical protein